MKNVVYFDLETQNLFGDVGGGHSPASLAKLKLSLGVTYSTKERAYGIWHEGTVDGLIRQLMRADLVVGHNLLGFDYHVLAPYTALDLSQIPTLDTCEDILRIRNARASLDNLAKATLGVSKIAVGTDAVKWWREGVEESLLRIAEYCCYDVKICRLLHEYGCRNGRVFCTDRWGQKAAIAVKW
ncbi:MAG: helicase [Verrucomicrobiae bacterium]|nr:helicase [Verrucomicrobiae bacterium]